MKLRAGIRDEKKPGEVSGLFLIELISYFSYNYKRVNNKIIKNNMRVGIVGGGFSGLLAAYRLSQKNISCILFEEDWRLGGEV